MYNELTNQGNVKWSQVESGGIRLDVDPLASLILAAIDAAEVKEGGVRVVQRGSNANGEYVRFADGTQIAVVRQGGIGAVNTSFGSGYIRSVEPVTWPAAFISAPRTFAFAFKSSGNAPIWATGGTGAASTTSAPAIWVNVWVSTSDTNNVVERLGIGRWK